VTLFNPIDQQNRDDNSYYAESVAAPDFTETYDAALGLVIDEGLTISTFLNREAKRERNQQVNTLINEGGYDRNTYDVAGGGFDYDLFARNTGLVKTDYELHTERNEMLARRRAYSESVTSGGGGVANFLGAAHGYMIDPLNAATMGVSTSVAAARSLTLAARMAQTGLKTAAVATATEAAIQPFVFNYKESINSPYSAGDALAAIGLTAVGGFGLGAGFSGVTGMFKKARMERAAARDEVLAQKMDGIVRNLEHGREVRGASPTIKASRVVADAKVEPEVAAVELSKDLESQIAQIEKESVSVAMFLKREGGVNVSDFDLDSVLPRKQGGKPLYRKKGGMDVETVREKLEGEGWHLTNEEVIELIQDISHGRKTPYLDQDAGAKKGQLEHELGEVSRAIDEGAEKDLFRTAFKADVEADLDTFRAMDDAAAEFENRQAPRPEDARPVPKAPNHTSQRQADILQGQELLDSFNRAMDDYHSLDNPKVSVDGEYVDGGVFMKQIDEEIDGLESVLVCAVG